MKNRIPIDLILIALLTIVSVVISLSSSVGNGTLQTALGLLFVLVAPGYALVSVLVPASASDGNRDDTDHTNLSYVERLLVAVGLSLVLVPTLALVVSLSEWGLDPTALLLSLGVTTLALSLISFARRAQLPSDHQFHLPVKAALDRVWSWLDDTDTRWELALNIFLVVGVVFVTVGIGAAIVAPPDGERYTEFFVEPEGEIDTESDIDNRSTELRPPGESEFVVGVTNQEHRTEQYSIVVELQRLEEAESDPTVVERNEVQRMSRTLDHNESREETTTIEPTMTGEGLRVTFLLYIGSPPENPSMENAYRSVYIWIDSPDAVEDT